jgi:hypothetical protein
MRKYRLSFAESQSHTPTHPERTASKHGAGMDFDVYYQVWPSRAAMLKSIDMQDAARDVGQRGWKAVQGGTH